MFIYFFAEVKFKLIISHIFSFLNLIFFRQTFYINWLRSNTFFESLFFINILLCLNLLPIQNYGIFVCFLNTFFSIVSIVITYISISIIEFSWLIYWLISRKNFTIRLKCVFKLFIIHTLFNISNVHIGNISLVLLHVLLKHHFYIIFYKNLTI